MASEVRTVQPGGVFASEWLVQGLRHAPLHLVAWTARDATDIDRWTVGYDGALRVPYDDLRRARRVALGARGARMLRRDRELGRLSRRAGADRAAMGSHAVRREVGGRRASERDAPRGKAADAMLFGAVHRAVSRDHRRSMEHLRDAPHRDGSPRARGRRRRRAARVDRQICPRAFRRTRRRSAAPIAAAGPSASRTSPDFQLLRSIPRALLLVSLVRSLVECDRQDAGAIGAPAMCEGIGELHTPSALAAVGNVRELRWLDSPEFARGVLRGFFAHQREDGSMAAQIFADHRSLVGVAQVNWGDAIVALDAAWPDDAFLREMYAPLSRYADWLLQSRDAESSGMIDILAPREIGERHSSRFEGVDPGGARDELSAGARLKGVDVTTYAYSLARALEMMAQRAGHPPDARKWRLVRERIADGAAHAHVGRRRARCSPMSILRAAHARREERARLLSVRHRCRAARSTSSGLERHLLDPAEFWTPFPVPVTALDDPFFSAYGEWKGQRRSQPWNGRVWPSVNSSVMDALANVAIAHAPRAARRGRALSPALRAHDVPRRRARPPKCVRALQSANGAGLRVSRSR